jgi:hypothetical protein
MAVNFDKLILSPPMQQNFIDPVTREPAIGKAFFFKAGCPDCPKAVYRLSGDPQDPFVPEIEIELDSSGSLPYDIWFYPFNEDNESEQQLYDWFVRTADNRIVFSRTNWPPTSEIKPNPNANVNALNLCPNFEFHSMVDEDINSNIPAVTGTIFAWGWKALFEDESTFNFIYSSNLLNQGAATDINQTPLNEVRIKFFSSSASTGFRRLTFYLGTYNAFQGKFIYASHFLRNISNCPSLTIKLLREIGSGTDVTFTTPITVGTLPIASNNLELSESTFQIPDITETTYSASDRLYISLEPQENVDLEFGITANFYQVVESITAKGTPSRFPFGLSLATAWFSSGDLNIDNELVSKIYGGNENPQSNDGLSNTRSRGERDVILKTGMVEEVLSGAVHQFNTGLLLTDSLDRLIYKDEVPRETGETIRKLSRSNRLISVLRDTALNKKHAFEATKTAIDTVNVSLKNGSIFLNDWVSSNPASILLTKNGSGFTYGVEAEKLTPSTMRLQYTHDFSVVSGFKADYPLGSDQSSFIETGFPIPPVTNIGNWYLNDFSDIPQNTTLYGSNTILSTQIPAGGGKGPGLILNYNSTVINNYVAKYVELPILIPQIVGKSKRYYDFIEIPSQSFNTRAIPYFANLKSIFSEPAINTLPSAGAIHLIYSRNTPSSQYMSGAEKTIVLEIPLSVSTKTELIDFTVASLVSLESYSIKTLSIPSHGQFIRFSNDIFDYVVVFAQEGFGMPPLPSGNFEKFWHIVFNPTETIEKFNERFVSFFDYLMYALPSLSELGKVNAPNSNWMINL